MRALDAEQGGAKYVDKPTVLDGNLVTARTWHDSALVYAPIYEDAPRQRKFFGGHIGLGRSDCRGASSTHRRDGDDMSEITRRAWLASMAWGCHLVSRSGRRAMERTEQEADRLTLSIGTYSLKGILLEAAVPAVAGIGYDGIEIAVQPGFDGEPARAPPARSVGRRFADSSPTIA